MNPISSDWNTAANWTPPTVPNASHDIATFSLSNQTSVFSISANIRVDSMVFDPDASAYTFTLGESLHVLGRAGIMNNSGHLQNFINTASCDVGFPGGIYFHGNASAGSQTQFTNDGGHGELGSGFVIFFGNSIAGEAVFVNEPACEAGFLQGGIVVFDDNASAGSAIFINEGGAVSGGGSTTFSFTAKAGNANITVHGGAVPGAIGSQVNFLTDSTAGSATFFAEGWQAEDALGGVILFGGTSLDSAENANFTINGGTPGSAFGGDLLFDQESDVGNAICVINGGTDGGPGGVLELTSSCTGGTARIELFGNGTLEMGSHDAPGVSVGSIEGDGLVFLGANNLTTGPNGLSTTFSGVIQDADRWW